MATNTPILFTSIKGWKTTKVTPKSAYVDGPPLIASKYHRRRENQERRARLSLSWNDDLSIKKEEGTQ